MLFLSIFILKALKGEKAELTIRSKDVYVTVYGEEVQQASKQAATKENIKRTSF